MSKIVSLDTETTGLDLTVHRIWEIGLVADSGEKMHYQVAPDNFKQADPTALRIGGFYERFTWPEAPKAHDMRTVIYHGAGDAHTEVNSLEMCIDLAKVLDGATILAANPAFDTGMLRLLFWQHNVAPAWSHRFLDLGSFCAGAWGASAPLSTKAIADRIPNEAAHTAFGDAMWNMEVFRSITGGQPL